MRALRQATAHWQTDPNPWVDSPTRPYATPPSAPASSRVSRRIVSAGMPLTVAACSGVKPATASRTRSTPSTYAAGRTAPSSSKRWCSIASSTTASVPGLTKTCSSATFAVSVRRGSTTTIRPPRAFRSRSRCGKSGTVISDPLEAIGLAPNTRKYDVRSMSGIGISSWCPKSSDATSWCGTWSTVLALNRLRVRSDFTIAMPWVAKPREWALGLPR